MQDTRLALGRLAADWRSRFDVPVIGITGSNGKTTVRAMTDAILSRRGRTLATQGNLNNDIGLPLTLARLGSEDRFAVIEMPLIATSKRPASRSSMRVGQLVDTHSIATSRCVASA